LARLAEADAQSPSDAATAAAESTDTGSTTAAVSELKPAIVIQPPAPHSKHKPKGEFKYKPLLRKNVLEHEPPKRKPKRDCDGCEVPEPKRKLKQKLLPVAPELRRRQTKADLKWQRENPEKAGFKNTHFTPNFYGDYEKKKELEKKREWERKHHHKKVPHHVKVIKRLPHVPEFYPKPTPPPLYVDPTCTSTGAAASATTAAATAAAASGATGS